MVKYLSKYTPMLLQMKKHRLELTTQSYWNKIWETCKVPIILSKKKYVMKRFDSLFKRVLPKNKNLKFIEIGCAPASWMIYFAREFDYKVFGSEFSTKGYYLSKKNLKIAGVRGKIFFDDIMNTKIKRKFDIVFSAGLIEHFENTHKIISQHVLLLKKYGFLILIIPNLRGLVGFLQKLLDFSIYAKHKCLSKEEIRYSLKILNLRVLKCDYFGSWGLGIVNIEKKKFLLFFFRGLDKIIQSILDLLNLQPESKFFSPYIIAIAQKV